MRPRVSRQVDVFKRSAIPVQIYAVPGIRRKNNKNNTIRDLIGIFLGFLHVLEVKLNIQLAIVRPERVRNINTILKTNVCEFP